MRSTNLRLARVAFVCGHADLIEEAVQALNDGGDLLGQIAGVHDVYAKLPAARVIVSMDHQARKCRC